MNSTLIGELDGPTDGALNVAPFAAGEQGPFLENLAAELTDVAYRVALQHGVGCNWIELQLGLWEALTGVIEKRSCLHSMKSASRAAGAPCLVFYSLSNRR
jgi:hypothetical protein